MKSSKMEVSQGVDDIDWIIIMEALKLHNRQKNGGAYEVGKNIDLLILLTALSPRAEARESF